MIHAGAKHGNFCSGRIGRPVRLDSAASAVTPEQRALAVIGNDELYHLSLILIYKHRLNGSICIDHIFAGKAGGNGSFGKRAIGIHFIPTSEHLIFRHSGGERYGLALVHGLALLAVCIAADNGNGNRAEPYECGGAYHGCLAVLISYIKPAGFVLYGIGYRDCGKADIIRRSVAVIFAYLGGKQFKEIRKAVAHKIEVSGIAEHGKALRSVGRGELGFGGRTKTCHIQIEATKFFIALNRIIYIYAYMISEAFGKHRSLSTIDLDSIVLPIQQQVRAVIGRGKLARRLNIYSFYSGIVRRRQESVSFCPYAVHFPIPKGVIFFCVGGKRYSFAFLIELFISLSVGDVHTVIIKINSFYDNIGIGHLKGVALYLFAVHRPIIEALLFGNGLFIDRKRNFLFVIAGCRSFAAYRCRTAGNGNIVIYPIELGLYLYVLFGKHERAAFDGFAVDQPLRELHALGGLRRQRYRCAGYRRLHIRRAAVHCNIVELGIYRLYRNVFGGHRERTIGDIDIACRNIPMREALIRRDSFKVYAERYFVLIICGGNHLVAYHRRTAGYGESVIDSFENGLYRYVFGGHFESVPFNGFAVYRPADKFLSYSRRVRGKSHFRSLCRFSYTCLAARYRNFVSGLCATRHRHNSERERNHGK